MAKLFLRPGRTWAALLTALAMLSLILLIPMLLAGGNDGGGAAGARPKVPQQTTITALVWAPDWPKEMHDIAAAFHRAHPEILVDVQFMIGNSVEENLKPKIAANHLPDLISVNPNAYAANLATQGILVDVGRSAAWDNMLDLLKPDWSSASHQHFGVAGGVAATLIYYNKEMFRQAGIMHLPDNFEEFLALCEKLKKAGFTPLVLDGGFPNMLGNGPFSHDFANNIAATRPDWRQTLLSGELKLNNPETADIFSKIKLLATRGYVQRDFMNTSYDEGINLFTEGRAAMTFEGTWAAGRLMNSKAVAAGVFIPPWNAAGKTVIPVIGSETGFAVCNTKNQAAAMLFLDFLMGEGFSIQQNARQNIPPMKRVPGKVVNNAQITAYIGQISAYPRVVPPYYAFLPASTIELLHVLLQDVLSGNISPRQAARRLDMSVREEASNTGH